MAEDLLLMTKTQDLNLTTEQLQAVGNAEFIFEPFKNDIQFDNFGQIRTTSLVSKLSQNVIKLLLTDIGQNIEDYLYGTRLNGLIGNKINSALYTEIIDTITNALNKYNELNYTNEESDEFLDSITDVNLFGDEKDPRAMYIRINLLTESGKDVKLSIPLDYQ